ncbi:MerR family transcriptional regulator [Liquorilactobacillus oeni]|uniref:HTH merR-type domain-containing protein n=1 Tax=Liquorilactobacillus oeni DSM 19972 TaxID=1423777 RepID=A0A0R1M916_9LACO|nr:MerR family transcriptional regulator [Liquorilactobacillus oeni]KRL04417.1 hypothetical protein FD46_GL001546 [Liquorilactobacillus oeni DSM 19972]
MPAARKTPGYRIGQVSELKSISPYTLRYYDNQKLLPKVFRDKNGARRFTEEDLQWLDMIKCLKNTNMPLEEIKLFVDSTYEGKNTLNNRIKLLQGQEKQIKKNIAQQQLYLEKVRLKIKTLKKQKEN